MTNASRELMLSAVFFDFLVGAIVTQSNLECFDYEIGLDCAPVFEVDLDADCEIATVCSISVVRETQTSVPLYTA